jgi:DUF971 family protein
VLSDDQSVEIHWPDGTVHHLPFRFLRGQCPCAACVDEMTGIRTLDVDAIPESIRPGSVSFTGNYALKIVWSDGHDTGLYTWEYLQELGNQQQATR